MKKLSFKKKNQLLLVGAVLLLLFVYRFAVSNSIRAYNRFSDATEQLQQAAGLPQQVMQLEKSLRMMSAETGEQATIKDESGSLLETVTRYCEGRQAVLREFPEASLSETEDLLVETNRFVVQGDFHTLLELVFLLEQRRSLGKVASARYVLKKDPKTKAMALTACVYLQQVKKK